MLATRYIGRFIDALRGPELHRTRKDVGCPGILHKLNRVEKYCSCVLLAAKCLWVICKVTSPLLIVIMYRKGSLDSIETATDALLNPFIFVMSVAGLAYMARGVGRCYNPEYMRLIRDLSQFHAQPTAENAERLTARYDCDFWALPTDFCVPPTKQSKGLSLLSQLPSARRVNLLSRVIALILLRTIGRRLLYPGSLKLIRSMMAPGLLEGRSGFVENPAMNGKRAKIGTSDGNFIDSLFVDKRGQSPRGNVLVICSEGNAGFYEVGIMTTPLNAGYSALGWNHPGFGWSTGEPLPSQEVNAAHAVMEYAIKHLKFAESDIMLFAWSIGGFPASYLAATYPHVRGVVLDATFDDLLPLAQARMPTFLGGIVADVVRSYLNLNVAELLCQYNGPVRLIRRTLDEMISIEDFDVKAMVNRGDFLLKRLLMHRYPKVVNAETMHLLDDWLRTSRQGRVNLEHRLNEHVGRLTQLLDDYVSQCAISSPYDISFPLPIGASCDLPTRQHLTLYLAHLHMKDIEATHCTPLPGGLFGQPWHLVDHPDSFVG